MKKQVSLFFVIGFIAFIFGCSKGDSSIYIAQEDVSEPKIGVKDVDMPSMGESIQQINIGGVNDIQHVTNGDTNFAINETMPSELTFILPGNVALKMKRCPAGSFYRKDGNRVSISKDFYMGIYEVTNAQYKAIMGKESVLTTDSKFDGDKQPVVNVSWKDIMYGPYYKDLPEPSPELIIKVGAEADSMKTGDLAGGISIRDGKQSHEGSKVLTSDSSGGFISQMNIRFASQLPNGYRFALPTEAQWEYSCRAGTTTDFSNGKYIFDDESCLSEIAWHYGNANEVTHNVGEKTPNSFGLYDMHGNVSEWCADWYGDYDGTNLTDPTGPETGTERILRGGSCCDSFKSCSSWGRFLVSPNFTNACYGFRLAIVPADQEVH